MNKIKIMTYFIIICLILTTNVLIAADTIKIGLLNSIQNQKFMINSDNPKTASFKILMQASMFDPNQGNVLKSCRATWESRNIAMKVIYEYLHNPIYVSLDSNNHNYQSIDYDNKGRLIVWRFLETYIISTTEKTIVLDKLQRSYVSPNGDFNASPDIYITKHIYHSKSNVDGNGDFKYFLMSSGLSLFNYIDSNSINIIKSNDNVIEINALGSFNDNGYGEWKIKMDQTLNYSVREASFAWENQKNIYINISTSDLVKKGELVYPHESHLVFNNSSARDYMDINVSLERDEGLSQEVKFTIESPLPKGSEIIEFIEGKPTRSTIK